MSIDRKQKLIELGAEALTDALLNLAAHSTEADDLIERLIATPKGNVQRFKKKLSALKRSRPFVDWRGARALARELEMLLQDLKSGVDDPFTGVTLVASFYEADTIIFEKCNDSSGIIGDVFRYDAREMFVDYASRCSAKEKIAELILRMNVKDSYGVRQFLVNSAGECLPEPIIRSMITILQERAENEKDEYDRRHHSVLIESLARQIKDAKLFEKTRIASWGTLSAVAYIDIARVYWESGDVESAHTWLKRFPEGTTYQSHERDQLLRKVYKKQGDSEKLTDLLYRNFRSYRSVNTLQELLDVIGHDKREGVIADEVILILESSSLQTSNVEFLISIGKIDEAEAYLLKRTDQLNGDFYGSLLPLAEAMELGNRYLAASMIYRSLLISILERAHTKSYLHGIRYLKKLDKLAMITDDWQKFTHHRTFMEQITKAHARKRSFWSKYGG
jgi:hypothetical protein